MSRLMKGLLLTLSLLLMGGLVVAGCSPSAGPEQPAVIKVGAHTSFTGAYSLYGIPMKQWMQMTADAVNDAGGVKVKGKSYQLQLTWEDNKTSAEGGIAAAEKLITQDKVQFLLGSITDSSIAASQVSEKNKIIHISLAGGPNMASPQNPYSFTYGSDASMGTFAFFARMNAYPSEFSGVKRIAFTGQDTGQARLIAKWMTAGTTITGTELVATEFFPVGTTDYGPVVTKVLSSKPDAVFIAGGGGDMGYLAKGLKDGGFAGQLVYTSPTPKLDDVLKIVPQEKLEGTIALVLGSLQPDPRLVQASEKYQQRHADEPKPTLLQYIGIQAQILAQAIEKADSLKSDDVKKAIESGMTFDTFLGPVRFFKAGAFQTDHAAWWGVDLAVLKAGKWALKNKVATADFVNAMAKVKQW